VDFQLPELGEGVYEAELVQWHVSPGDAVRRGQRLAEVMTDKATMELPSPFAGTIDVLLARPGDVLKIGQVVLRYTAAERAPVAASPVQPPSPPATGALAPSRAEEASAGGAPAAAEAKPGSGAAPASQAAPQTTEPAPASPAARSAAPQPPQAPQRPAAAAVAPSAARPAPPSDVRAAAPRVAAAPTVRRMARQLNIDLRQVRGSGPGGRVLLDDLVAHIPRDGRGPAAPEAPVLEVGTAGTRSRLTGLRRTIAERLAQATRSIPHYSYVDECDVTELVRLREELKPTLAAAGLKLTYLPFFVKAAVAALKQVPLVNASLDEQAGEIVLHDQYHIGFAVAAPAGLLVPVIRHADRKNLVELAREIERLSAEARAGRAQREDLRGGTFTITSIGNIGGLISTPIINPPEVGILGIGRIVRRPVFDESGNVVPADVVYLSCSFDHRVVDGAVGALFVNALIRQLQRPAALLLPEPLER
jgi:pyruvate dehydrogenase E2 component (dihydrolipoamide acetyltransferase)/2-oxoisovalerate dehydrogenase E2 component (dihydrolipoyl transacylase)